ncbi:hypothetical protein [Desulfocurvibacter africanus]|uniref:hypothetical protein n=1 Tax=Desulfocurvibacter africanus TaxID=873 RepID=UPI0003F720AE|nr:hypothetical protein [Desulfocurvibacter africanus]
MRRAKHVCLVLKHFAFQTLPSALTAELHSAYACRATSHADAWLAEHFQKQNALVVKFLKNLFIIVACQLNCRVQGAKPFPALIGMVYSSLQTKQKM